MGGHNNYTIEKEKEVKLWTLLGHEPELAEDLALLQLEWRDDFIYCNAAYTEKYVDSLADQANLDSK